MITQKKLQRLRLKYHGDGWQPHAPAMLGDPFDDTPMPQVQTIEITNGQHTAISQWLQMM
jgi:hypothetical protein